MFKDFLMRNCYKITFLTEIAWNWQLYGLIYSNLFITASLRNCHDFVVQTLESK